MSNLHEKQSDVIRAELIDLEDGGRVVAYFESTSLHPVTINGNIYIVTAWDGDNLQPCDTDFFAKIYVKWDGCSHIMFHGQDYHKEIKEDSYYHICGAWDYVNHMRMLSFAYEIMVEHVGYSNVLEIGDLEDLRKLNLINEQYQIRYFYDNKQKDTTND